ncbi:MAG TPA: nitroreductase family deazaflavin-dependent oxidoreductase [Thermoleophilaceae bacterium]
MYEYAETNWIRRMVRVTAALRPISWFYARTLHHIDRVVYRLTRGRSTFSSFVAGVPVAMLTTTGAKSRQPRTLPVLGIPHDDRLVVIASNYGRYRNPGWYHNLLAHPRASIVFEGETRAVLAHELSGGERERWYERGIEIYPGWRQYRERAAHRRIPVIELRPAER